MNPIYKCLLLILLLTLLIFGYMWIPVQAQTEPPIRTTADNCVSCHSDVYAVWHQGGHGDARSYAALSQANNCMACHKEIPQGDTTDSTSSDTSFNTFWVEQGQPMDCVECHVTGYDPNTREWKEDGIACEACHNPIPPNHPNTPMPIAQNAERCQNCHTDARFDWSTWQDSVHFQKDMTCMDCHDPHTTSLQITKQETRDASALCKNCHVEIAQTTSHSIHEKAGATCVTCHLGPTKGKDDFHQVPDHDFKPKLEACNTCHAQQMHSAGLAASVSTPAAVSPTSQAIPTLQTTVEQESQVTAEPGTASPFGFSAFGAVVGLVVGISWRRRRLLRK